MDAKAGALYKIERVNRLLTVAVVTAAHAFSHLNNQGISVLYPILRDQFRFGYTGIAVLALIGQIAGGPVQICYGVLTRFVRRVRILAIGSILAFLGVSGVAISQTYTHLLVFTMLRGLGTSPNHTVGGAVMSDSFPEARSRGFATYQTAGNIGGWIAPIVVGSLLYFMEWRFVLFILSLPLLLACFLFFSLKEPGFQSDAVLGKKRRGRLGLSEYKTVIRDRNSLIIALVMMVGASGRGTGALNTYLTALVVDRFGISVPIAAAFFAAYMLGGVIGPLSLGWFADRTSPRLTLRLSLILSAVFALLLLAPRTPGSLLGVISFFAGFFIFSRGPLTQSMLVSLWPEGVRVDTLLSVYATMSTITGPFWIFLTGVLVDHFGMATALTVMAASYILGMVILSFLKVDAKQQTSQTADNDPG